MTRKQAIEVLKDMRFGVTKEQAEALNKAITDLEAIENGIQAKALRKKDTYKWYYQDFCKWMTGLGFADMCNSMVTSSIGSKPTDAELVDVTIIVNGADIKP